MMRSAAIAAEMQPGMAGGAASTVPLTISTTGGSTRTAEPAPEQMGLLQDANVQRGEQAEQQVEQGIAEGEELKTKATGADDMAVQNLLNLAETEDAIAANKARVAEAQALAEQSHKEAEDAAKAIVNYDYWAHKSTGDHVIAKLATGISGIGAAYLGQPNEVLASINKDIDRDFDLQKAYVTSKEHAAELRRKGVADVQAQLEKELAALKVKHGQALDATAKKAEAMALRAGAPIAQAKNNVIAAGLRAGASEKTADALKDFEVHHERNSSTSVAQHLLPQQAPQQLFGPGGEPIAETTGKSREDIGKTQDKINAARILHKNLDELLTSYEKEGKAFPKSDLWERRQALRKQIVLNVKNAEQLGALSGSDVGLAEGFATSDLDQVLGSGTGRIRESMHTLKRSLSATLEGAGVRGGEQVAERALGGAPEPKTAPSKPETRRGPSDIEIAQAQDWLRKNPNDPRAPMRRKNLQRALKGGR